MSDGATSLDSVFSAFNMSTLASVAGIKVLVDGFRKLTGAISGFIKSSVASFAQFEGLQKSLNVTIGDGTKALTEFQALKEYANSTPYTVTGLASVASQLHAVGIGSEEAMEMLKRFGDVALGDSDKMQRIAANYAQIVSVGKTSAIDTKQFAMMGIPIYDMFKKIGVEGNATAEQVKQAFIMMTEEGGKFYGGMEAGRDSLNVAFNQLQGAIQSLRASFGSLFENEAKTSLSLVTKSIVALDEVVSKLNEHPIIKWLIMGTIGGAVAALGVTIAKGLIPAFMSILVKLNLIKKEMTLIALLKSLIDPKTLLIGLGVGLLTGAVAGTVALINKHKEDNEELQKTLETEKQIAEIRKQQQAAVKQYQASGTDTTSLDSMKNTVVALQAMLGKEVDRYMLLLNLDDVEEEEKQSSREKIKTLKSQVDSAYLVYNTELKRLENERLITAEAEKQNSLFNTYAGTIEELYAKTKEGKILSLRNQINDYESILNQGYIVEQEKKQNIRSSTGYEIVNKKVPLTEDFIHKAEIVLAEWKKELERLEGKTEEKTNLPTEPMLAEWQQFLKKMYGFSDEENKYLKSTDNQTGTQAATSHYLSKVNSMLANRQIAENLLISSGLTTKTEGMESLLNYQKGILESEMANLISASTGVDSNGNLMWGSKEELNKFNELIAAMGKLKEEIDDNTKTLEKTKARETTMNAFKKGDIIGGGRGMIAESELNYDSGNYWKGTGQELGGTMISQFLPNVLSSIDNKLDKSTTEGKAMSAAFGGIQSMLNGTNPLVATIMAVANFLLNWLMDDDDDAEEEQSEILKAIKGQLETLSQTVSDQLKYLNEVQLKMQQDFINNQISAGVRSVNDMILTPHGAFSTAPDDYLIATKNPYGLSGGNHLNVVINDYGNNEVNVSERKTTDGMTELVVNISKKVASDAAQGLNGWDSAMAVREQRLKGRSL